MLEIHISTRFKRSFKKLPNHIKEDFPKKLQLFQQEPYHHQLSTHKLNGKLGEYYAFYLKDGYRVLFDFEDNSIALLVNIGNHNDYKKWEKQI